MRPYDRPSIQRPHRTVPAHDVESRPAHGQRRRAHVRDPRDRRGQGGDRPLGSRPRRSRDADRHRSRRARLDHALRRDLPAARGVPGHPGGPRGATCAHHRCRSRRRRLRGAALATRVRAEHGPGPAADLARRGDRDHGDRPRQRRLQRGRRQLLPAALRHGRQRGRERQAVRRAAGDPDPVPVADRTAAGDHLPRRRRDRREPVRQPAEHTAVRDHAGGVDGEPGGLARAGSSRRPRSRRGGVRRSDARRTSRSAPSIASDRPTASSAGWSTTPSSCRRSTGAER